MAFLKTRRSRGDGEILINLDHVQDLRPVSKTDRRTKVTFVQYDDDEAVRTLNVHADFDTLAADWNYFGDSDKVQPLP